VDGQGGGRRWYSDRGKVLVLLCCFFEEESICVRARMKEEGKSEKRAYLELSYEDSGFLPANLQLTLSFTRQRRGLIPRCCCVTCTAGILCRGDRGTASHYSEVVECDRYFTWGELG